MPRKKKEKAPLPPVLYGVMPDLAMKQMNMYWGELIETIDSQKYTLDDDKDEWEGLQVDVHLFVNKTDAERRLLTEYTRGTVVAIVPVCEKKSSKGKLLVTLKEKTNG